MDPKIREIIWEIHHIFVLFLQSSLPKKHFPRVLAGSPFSEVFRKKEVARLVSASLSRNNLPENKAHGQYMGNRSAELRPKR